MLSFRDAYQKSGLPLMSGQVHMAALAKAWALARPVSLRSLIKLLNTYTKSWSSAKFSSGPVDCLWAKVEANATGFYRFTGNVFDNSIHFGDRYKLSFTFKNGGHGDHAEGVLGAKESGPPPYQTFNVQGTDPWLAENWEWVYAGHVDFSLEVTEDPSQQDEWPHHGTPPPIDDDDDNNDDVDDDDDA
jgi:hypothetical protein